MLFLTGCVEVEIESVIRRDGTVSLKQETVFVMTEEEFADMNENGTVNRTSTTDEGQIEEYKQKYNIKSLDVYEIDETVGGYVRQGAGFIGEIGDLESYAGLLGEILSVPVSFTEEGSKKTITIDYSLVSEEETEGEDPLGLMDDFKVKSHTKFTVEGTILNHNASKTDGNTLIWDETFEGSELKLEFTDEIVESNAPENISEDTEIDEVAETISVKDGESNDTFKLVSLGLVLLALVSLSGYAFILSRKEQ